MVESLGTKWLAGLRSVELISAPQHTEPEARGLLTFRDTPTNAAGHIEMDESRWEVLYGSERIRAVTSPTGLSWLYLLKQCPDGSSICGPCGHVEY